MKKQASILLLIVMCVFTSSCQEKAATGHKNLVSMQIIDRNGFSETIGSKDRLSPYNKVDYLSAQPYQKVLRVFSKNNEGKSSSTLTTYHPNGQIYSYLDIIDGRAHGKYRQWYANGTLQFDLTVLDGIADMGELAQKSWIFDETASVFDEKGQLTAEIFYDKGVLNTPSLYYHPNGELQKKSPFVCGVLQGEEEVFDQEGNLIEKHIYQAGKKEGLSIGYWEQDKIQFNEHYDNDLLQKGSYYNKNEELISSIIKGKGMKAFFDPRDGTLTELHEFTDGKPEGAVKVFDAMGALTLLYHVKDNMKHGEEWKYFPSSNPDDPPKPKMMVTWHEDLLQGAVKTWYKNGTQESSREMHQNKKQGYSFAWYVDGSLLLSEEYDQNRLEKGSYFTRNNKHPISKVEKGKGTVTIYDAEGKLCKKIPYDGGVPLIN